MKYVFAPIKKIGFINNLSLLFQRKTGKKIIEISAKNNAGKMYLRNGTTDIHTFYDIFTNDEYDIDFGFIPRTIVDCGANIGLVSVFYKGKYPEVEIIAIEPEKSNFEMLVKNTAQFKDVHCLQNAVWGNEGFIEITDPGLGNWGFMTTETVFESDKTIKTVTINEIMQKFQLQVIDVLKIDIEGAEKEVFENDNLEWLSKTRIILIELHDRLKQGCSKAFFKAISNMNFKIEIKGELLVCIRADELSK